VTQLENRRLLLDTHVFLWLLIGSGELERSGRVAEIEAAAEQDSLCLSAISIWELTEMELRGVLRLSQPTQAWLEQALGSPGLRVVAVDREISFAAATLPDRFEGDFADRCIVATARTHNCELLTADAAIQRYAAGGYVRVAAIAREHR